MNVLGWGKTASMQSQNGRALSSTSEPTLTTRSLTRSIVRQIGRVKALHYVSSISAFGPTGIINGVTYISEDEPLQPHLNALPYDHGYSQSQWVAEQILWSAIRRGFPIAIYRPGFVTGSSSIGFSNPDDFLSRLMTACLSMGSYPVLPNQRKEFVTVEWVTSAILHISSCERNLGHAYHLVPQHTASTDMQETFRLPNIQACPTQTGSRGSSTTPMSGCCPCCPCCRRKCTMA